jgi:aromatic ring-opening dioxygenase catalytic subunit (LigB family)
MAHVVLIAASSHAPMMAAMPDSAPPAERAVFFEALGDLRGRLRAARPDVLVVVSNEHFTNFFLDNFPPLCVGVADAHTGPAEPWLGIARGPVPGHADLAGHVLRELTAGGIEPAFSHRLVLDHGIMTVARQLDPAGELPIVPIIQNCAVAPLAPLGRSLALGEALVGAIASHPSELRVAIVGAGGLSHWVGTPEVGDIDEAFDRWFLDALAQGALEDVAAVPDAEIELAGNGAHEIRSWLVAAGAARACGRPHAEVLGYAAIHPWITGMGVAVWEPVPA